MRDRSQGRYLALPRAGAGAIALLLLARLVLGLPTDQLTALQAATGSATESAGAGGSAAVDAVVAAAALLGWACVGHLLVVGALLLLSRTPGAVGRGCGRATRALAPLAVRRGLAVVLGLALAGGTAGPAAALAVDEPTRPVPAASSWDWPAAPADPVLPAPPHEAPARHDGEPPAALTAEPVVVRPGDCLWHLAAASLGPTATDAAVAAAWPSWWSTNREVIGDDPDLLLPGQVLQPPV